MVYDHLEYLHSMVVNKESIYYAVSFENHLLELIGQGGLISFLKINKDQNKLLVLTLNGWCYSEKLYTTSVSY